MLLAETSSDFISVIFLILVFFNQITCSRRSDSRAREKNSRKKGGETRRGKGERTLALALAPLPPLPPPPPGWDAWLTIVICFTFLFAISAFVLQPERGSFQNPRTVATDSRTPCASNIWQKRQEKQQFLAELQPANQTDEELQLKIALELSKKQAEIDEQQR